jgi:hypothetical protein
MKDGSYHITTPNYIFELSIIKVKDNYTIQYGNYNNLAGPCVELTYDLQNKHILSLENISYDNNLQKSDGTIEMLMSILKLCILKFPDIKKLYLKMYQVLNVTINMYISHNFKNKTN